jgi:erythromycin esterase-like protein
MLVKVFLLLFWLMLGAAFSAETTTPVDDSALISQLREAAIRLTDATDDYKPLLNAIGDANIVLLGEATHGSTEFYAERSRITRRLIEEKGFDALILEAGWAPALPMNDYVQGRAEKPVCAAFSGVKRFPRWTWRNAEFAATLASLRAMNQGVPEHSPRIAVYGMDMYEAPEAIDAVLAYLRQIDPRAARQARRDYACFRPYHRLAFDPQLYGRDLVVGRMPSCQRSVEVRAEKLRQLAAERQDAASFGAWMSARSVVGAEAYYRSAYTEGPVLSWNVRERFMLETLRILLNRHRKVVVWAHNTHIGDSRQTDQAKTGELALGQLVREQYGEHASYSLGFSTHQGSVRAASGWGTANSAQTLLPALVGRWPSLLHETGQDRFLVLFRDNPAMAQLKNEDRLERAIGVNYFSAREREDHYFTTRLARRFDALIHLDQTTAVPSLRAASGLTASLLRDGGNGCP